MANVYAPRERHRVCEAEMTTSFHIEDVDGLHSRTAKTRTGSDSSRTSTEAHWHGCCTTEARVRAPLPDNTAWLCETRTAAPTHNARRDRWPSHPTSSGVILNQACTMTHSSPPMHVPQRTSARSEKKIAPLTST